LSTFVVDASVAIKWFLPEIHSEAAGRILKSKHKLLAPDLIMAEVGNTLWKKNIRNEISLEESRSILKDFLRFPLQIYHSKTLLAVALHVAVQYGFSVYDGLYLALALTRKVFFITADHKFYESLHKGTIGQKIAWVEDVT